MAEKLKVMTFNLRYANPNDGINYLENRKGRILETIVNEAPDLIGFQEVQDEMRSWLRNNIRDYTVIGCGRRADYSDESAVVAFRNDKFELIKSENVWLSSTPAVSGSRYEGVDQSSCPRLFTSVVLKHHLKDEPILFVNTHTDFAGPLSRILASAQLLQYISSKNMPTVLTGDFNALPEDTEIRMLTENTKFKLTDATASLGGTFHDFGRKTGELSRKIDYVFTNLPTDVTEAYAVEDIPVEGVYISDHQPVVAFAEL